MTIDLSKRRFTPLAMRAARIVGGLTLDDVGMSLGTSRQWVLEIETGIAVPNRATISRLAECLSVPETFLMSGPRGHEVMEESIFFRASAGAAKRDKLRARIGVELLLELVEKLRARLRFPVPNLPRRADVAAGRRPPSIADLAAETRRRLDVPLDAPIADLVRVIESAGIVVVDTNSQTETVDAFSVGGSKPVIVRSTAKGSTSRARLSLAHELAHLVLHTENPTDHDAHKAIEDEANQFAGAFLFPPDCLRREFNPDAPEIWSHLFRLKARWGLSIAAIVFQACRLGLIDPLRERGLWITIAKRGWRRNEPQEPAPENPELLRLAFERLCEADRIGPEDLLERFGWNARLLKTIVGRSIATRVLDCARGRVLQLPVATDQPAAKAPALKRRAPTSKPRKRPDGGAP